MSILVVMDSILIFFAYFVAFIFRFKYTDISIADVVILYGNYIGKMFFICALFVGIFVVFRQYKSIWSIASIDEFIGGVIASSIATIITLTISYFDNNRIPLMITIMAGIMIMIFCNGIRIGWRVVRRTLMFITDRSNGNCKRVLVVGAGGQELLLQMNIRKIHNIRKR